MYKPIYITNRKGVEFFYNVRVPKHQPYNRTQNKLLEKMLIEDYLSPCEHTVCTYLSKYDDQLVMGNCEDCGSTVNIKNYNLSDYGFYYKK